MAILLVRMALRIVNLPRLLQGLSTVAVPQSQNRATLEDVVYYCDKWLRLFPYNRKGNCLPRALTLYWFARRYGFPVKLHCGIHKNGDTLDGHAWLTQDNEPFMETGKQVNLFAVTFSFPPSLIPPAATGGLSDQSERSAPLPEPHL